MINSAPTRNYVLGADGNPRQTPVMVAGAGVTPITGLRLGVSVAHGVYATPDEIRTPVSRGRRMTMAGGEGEWAFGCTKIGAEILRTAFDTTASQAIAYEWFVQGTQTLSPRWFVAARREGTSAPAARQRPRRDAAQHRRVRSDCRLSRLAGRDAAQRLLRPQGVRPVHVEGSGGHLDRLGPAVVVVRH